MLFSRQNVSRVYSKIAPNLGLDKSTSDVAAEGAILNEMLDIVAKRAALRSNESQQSTSLNSDVSDALNGTRFPTSDFWGWILVCLQFFIVYACILHFANSL